MAPSLCKSVVEIGVFRYEVSIIKLYMLKMETEQCSKLLKIITEEENVPEITYICNQQIGLISAASSNKETYLLTVDNFGFSQRCLAH